MVSTIHGLRKSIVDLDIEYCEPTHFTNGSRFTQIDLMVTDYLENVFRLLSNHGGLYSHSASVHYEQIKMTVEIKQMVQSKLIVSSKQISDE